MKPLAITFTLTAAVVGLTGFLIGFRISGRHVVLMFIVLVLVSFAIGQRLRSRHEPWLPSLMALAIIAKLVGASARYYVLEVVYHGSGDAGRYHGAALEIADMWRDLAVPDVATVAFGGEGTRFTAWITGLLYAPYEPSMLAGFWLFAFLAFVGQLFLYLAFRNSFQSSRWQRYALLIFFWPTLIYWPSSIGKEALIIFFIGVGSWAASHFYGTYRSRWLPVVAGSLFLIAQVRIHVAAVLAASLLAGALFEKWSARPKIAGQRLIALTVGVFLAIPLATGVASQLGISLESLDTADLEPVFSSVGDVTGQGGSAVTGGVIRSPLDIPAGTLKVLFRPLPIEARNSQMLISSLEGTALLALVLWQAPNMWRNRGMLRRSPYLLFALAYTSLFIWAWSSMLNLGILARQRSLVLPFVLALVAGLGWTEPTQDEEHDQIDEPIQTIVR